jgi:hypothetical protein
VSRRGPRLSSDKTRLEARFRDKVKNGRSKKSAARCCDTTIKHGWNKARPWPLLRRFNSLEGLHMGRAALLWLLGVPIPIILLILLFWH